MPKPSRPVPKSPAAARQADRASMVDTFSPPVALLCKLGSLAVHADELVSNSLPAHIGCDLDANCEAGFDIAAIRSLLADREVQQWIASMDAKAMLPKKRS